MERLNHTHYLFNLKDLSDKRGGLVVIEGQNNVPIEISRVFYIYATKQKTLRGNHANIHSRFVMISVAGSCVIEVDDGINKKEYLLDSPLKALFINKMIWKTMKEFSPDNVLLVLSDSFYDENEYITNYDDFISRKLEAKVF